MIIVIIVLTQLQNLEYLKLSLLYQNLLMTSKYIIPHSTIILQSQLNFHIFLHHQTLVRKNGRPSSTRTPKVVRINTLILCENFVFVLNSIKTPVLDTWLSQPSTSVFNYRYVSLWMLTGSMYNVHTPLLPLVHQHLRSKTLESSVSSCTCTIHQILSC